MKERTRPQYKPKEVAILLPEANESIKSRNIRLNSNINIDREGFVQLRTEFKEHRIQTDKNFEDIKNSLRGTEDMKTQFTAHVASDTLIFQQLTTTLNKLDKTLETLMNAHQQDIGSKITKKQIWTIVATTLVLVPAVISLVVHFLLSHK